MSNALAGTDAAHTDVVIDDGDRDHPTASPRTVALAYIEAVGQKQFDRVCALLHPDVDFEMPGRALRGVQPYVAALRRLGSILLQNEVTGVVVDHDQVCVMYDFVTDTAVGAVPSAEWLRIEDGQIRSVRLLFERARWPQVLAELARRASQV